MYVTFWYMSYDWMHTKQKFDFFFYYYRTIELSVDLFYDVTYGIFSSISLRWSLSDDLLNKVKVDLFMFLCR